MCHLCLNDSWHKLFIDTLSTLQVHVCVEYVHLKHVHKLKQYTNLILHEEKCIQSLLCYYSSTKLGEGRGGTLIGGMFILNLGSFCRGVAHIPWGYLFEGGGLNYVGIYGISRRNKFLIGQNSGTDQTKLWSNYGEGSTCTHVPIPIFKYNCLFHDNGIFLIFPLFQACSGKHFYPIILQFLMSLSRWLIYW